MNPYGSVREAANREQPTLVMKSILTAVNGLHRSDSDMFSAAGIVPRSVGIRAHSNSPMHVCFNPVHRVSEPEMLPFSLVVAMRQETRQISSLSSIGGNTPCGWSHKRQ